jgi:SAM-dependent methyltransferase
VKAVIRFTTALDRAREAAFAPGEYVGQESFVSATQIRALASRAGIRRGTSVLDLCCGTAGPGRMLAGELRCRYLGVDRSAEAIAVARERVGELPCRFQVAEVPPIPAGRVDVVLLLETMLAFSDKQTLIEGVSHALGTGGRFACTLEEGEPLTAAERTRMPNADTVWPAPLESMRAMLEESGLTVAWQDDWSAAHRATATALADCYAAGAEAIAAEIGRRELDDLVAAHRLWSEWLAGGRVRKLAIVAEKR